MNRRTFIYNVTLGTLHLATADLSFAQTGSALKSLKIDVQAPDMPLSPLGMPGLFPGRVVQVFHSGSLVDRRVSQPAVRTMVDEGMKALTGESVAKDGWAKLFVPSDIVAIKVNPSGVPGTVTSIALVREVIQALNSVGVPNKNVIVYDRNSNQLEVNGYHTLVPSGVRVVGLDQRWKVKGETRSGYDPDVFVEMDCFGERETRSYLASIVTTEANKVINLPCLKEHNASGVTGCLKNLAYGSFNNVARTHVDPKTYTDPVIAVMCTAAPLRSKSVLHIMDGIRAVYQGGPFAWNPEFVWEAKTLLFGTDPVAVDRIELETVEQKRKEVGVPSLWDRDPKYLGTSGDMQKTAFKNPFYREPGHIRTASELGLGKWDLKDIDLRKLRVGYLLMDTNWVTLLASNDRRGGTPAARVKAPNELIWKVELADAVRSSPILRDGVIYVTSRNGRLYALDSKTGRERWVFQAAAAVDSTPSISGDLIFFGCDDGAVYAVDRTSGRMRWKAEGAGPIWTSPTIHNDSIYIGSTDGTFKAIDLTTGKPRWSRQLEGQICSTAYAAERLVYFGSSNGRIYALDLSSGKDAWVHQAGDGVTASPAVTDGLVLAGSEDFVFYALDAESGKVRWKLDTDLGIYSSAAVAGGKVFFGGKDGYLYALNLADGRTLWKSEPLRTLTAPPVAGETVVCMQTFYGGMQAFDVSTGKRLWRANLGGSLQSTPILTEDAVYLATYPGVVYALR